MSATIPLGTCILCDKRQATPAKGGVWLLGKGDRWACDNCFYYGYQDKPRLHSKPVYGCEDCANEDVVYGQGGWVMCSRCGTNMPENEFDGYLTVEQKKYVVEKTRIPCSVQWPSTAPSVTNTETNTPVTKPSPCILDWRFKEESTLPSTAPSVTNTETNTPVTKPNPCLFDWQFKGESTLPTIREMVKACMALDIDDSKCDTRDDYINLIDQKLRSMTLQNLVKICIKLNIDDKNCETKEHYVQLLKTYKYK